MQQLAGIHHCRVPPFSCNRYKDMMQQARKLFRTLQRRTKRRPYVRSAYFRKDKVFFEYFWVHLNQKSLPDRARRLKYLPCAIELIRTSMQSPTTFVNRDEPNAIHHQFKGVTSEKLRFFVIVKQDRASGKKHLLSIFPE